ncbi:MAG: hypothetical protein B5M51_04580 [Anaerolinea sp. 4484_236]|nr:MAG: hypothetical protein B5M51_04580 [Anaerolinea sp. 4484_236]
MHNSSCFLCSLLGGAFKENYTEYVMNSARLSWYDSRTFKQVQGIMDDKITIIEGPPPIFEPVQDGWALGLNEGPDLLVTALTRLRTFNGPELVERCYRAWHQQTPIHLLYRDEMGLEQEAPIQAVRSVDSEDGGILLLWVYLERDMVEFEIDRGDDESANDDFER